MFGEAQQLTWEVSETGGLSAGAAVETDPASCGGWAACGLCDWSTSVAAFGLRTAADSADAGGDASGGMDCDGMP